MVMPEDMDLEKWAHQHRKAYLVESIPENGLVESLVEVPSLGSSLDPLGGPLDTLFHSIENPLPPQKRYPFRGSYSKEPAIHSAFPTHCSSDGTENHAIQTSCDTYERYRSSLRVVPNPAPKPVDLGPIPGIQFHSHSCILCTLLHTFQLS